MRLIKNWHVSWRWFSMQAMTAAAALQGVWGNLPDDLRDRAPDHLVATITALILILGLVGRLVDQGGGGD